MSEREKEIIKTIAEAIPQMSEFEKGYLLGVAESRASDKRKNDDEKENEAGEERED